MSTQGTSPDRPLKFIRLSSHIYKTTLGFSLSVLGIFTMVFLFISLSSEVKTVEETMDKIFTNQNRQIALSIWNLHEELLAAQIEGILMDPLIHHAEVKDSALPLSRSEGPAISNSLKKDYTLTFLGDDGLQEVIGVLELESDLDRVWARTLGLFWSPVLLVALIQILTTVFLLFILNTVFIKRLGKFSRFFSQMEVDTLHQPLDISYAGMTHVNELDEVAQRVNEMRENLQKTFLARKDAEDRLRDTAKTIQIQLAQLEAQNTELERFTYTVSHDLRSPLITIHGFAQYLLEDLRKGNFDRADQDLKKIMNAADKMGHLLNDLLEMSRIGRVINKPTKFIMAEVVQEALDLLEGPLQTAGVQIIQENLGAEVQADRLRIREVWQNLIENSVKYSQPGVPAVLTAGSYIGEDQRIFYLKDNGIGVPPEFLDKIFGLFEKLNPVSQGNGIGLALVKRIINLHGGRIWAQSQGIGQGTTILFTLGTLDEFLTLGKT